MGTYINPPDNVKVIGRMLVGGTFQQLVEDLRPNEYLVGLYDRPGMFKGAPVLNMPHITGDAEFEEFEKQVRTGDLVREGFYAVPKGEIGE